MRKITEITAEFVRNIIPPREQDSHKGTFGSVLNIAGSRNYHGAAFLSSLAPLKVGAGYVTLAAVDEVIKSVSAKSSEIVFFFLKNDDYTISPKAVKDISKIIEKHKVISIGCGLNSLIHSNSEVELFVKDFFEEFSALNNTFVIDADAINALAKIKQIELPQNSILTPHPLELARLLDVSVNEILNNKMKYAQTAADKFNAVIVLKGHETIIADSENVYINQSGNSALAKAGSGDVLTGMIAGFAAQGATPCEAAVIGVYLHGAAGKLASEKLTQYGVLATDLLEYIPCAIKHLFD